MKIKMKLIIITAVLLIVTVAAFGAFLKIVLDSTGDTMYNNYLRNVAELERSSLDAYINDISERYDSIVSIPAVKTLVGGNYSKGSSEYKAAADALGALVESKAISSAVVYETDDKVFLAKGGENDSLTAANAFCNVSAENGMPVVFKLEGSNESYGVSIKNKVGSKYFVGLVFTNEGVNNILSRSKGLAFVVDPLKSVLSNQVYVGNFTTGNVGVYSSYQSALNGAKVDPAKEELDGEILYVCSLTNDENSWIVAVKQEKSMTTKASGDASGAVIGIAIAMLVICFVAATILIIIVTKPFYKIQDTLLKISRGDHEARVEIMTKNEYGDIARVFNDIVDNIIVSESRYRTIIEMSDNIIFEWNLNTKEVIFSNNFNKKFSYRAPSEHFADSFLIKCKVHPEDAERYTSDLQKLEKGTNFKHNEYRIKNIYGDYIWVLIRTASIVDQDGKAVKIVGVIVDIDRAKKSENILTARASFDSLTNVFNRETIEVAINNEIELIAARKTEFAILFVDIDDFKFYNDQYSHATGDQVLRFTATTIKNAVGDKGMVGRYGGDEFIVCIKDADNNDPSDVAKQILETLKEGFDGDSGDHFSINVSIGISVIKDNTKRVEEIIGQADDAMYKIKKAGKSNFGYLDS